MWGPPNAMAEEPSSISHHGIVPRIFKMLFSELERVCSTYYLTARVRDLGTMDFKFSLRLYYYICRSIIPLKRISSTINAVVLFLR